MCLGHSPRIPLLFALKKLVGEASWIQIVETNCNACKIGVYWEDLGSLSELT